MKPAAAPAPLNPIPTMQHAVKEPMAQVNAVILERLHSSVPLIPQLAQHLINAGGKRLRPSLTLLCAQLGGAVPESAIKLAAAVEFIHSATLLHDDVVDESNQRRGQESARAVWGNAASVLVGDFLFARAFELMVETGSLPALQILSRAAATIAQGEVMQLQIQNSLTTKREDYMAVIDYKTAELFAAACHVGALAGKLPEKVAAALSEYGRHLGIAFQITDDLLDYTESETTLGKPRGNDLREGKVTLPVIIAYEHADANAKSFWQRTIAEGSVSDTDISEACRLITPHSAAVMRRASLHVDNAHNALAKLGAHSNIALLRDLASFSMSRKA